MEYTIKPYPHQEEILKLSDKENSLALFWEMGCITGDSLISTNSEGCFRKIPIEQLYRGRQKGKYKNVKVRSYKHDIDRVQLHTIQSVLDKGVKEILKLELEDGKSIRLTPDHEVFTSEGFIECQKLQIGSLVAVDSRKPYKSEKPKKKISYLCRRVGDYHPYRHKISTFKRGKRVQYNTLEVHRLTAEASLNELPLEEFIRLTKVKCGEKLKYIDPDKYHVHHKNHDPRDNRLENLEILPKEEHQKHHGNNLHFNQGIVRYTPVKAIKKAGYERVYDIVCDDPYRNFVANDIVIHNSGKTYATINMIRKRYYEYGRVMKTLIFAPQVTLYNWKNEFKKFSKVPQDMIHVSKGSGKKRVQHLQKCIQHPCVFIVNWEALRNQDICEILEAWQPEIVVGDELHLIKNYKAKRSKAAVAIADSCRKNSGYIYGLTGTAILNSIEDIFMQFRFLDGGSRFGGNFFTFRRRYMYDANDSWSHQEKHFPDFKPRPEMFEELNHKMFQIATKVTKAEAMKHLPPLVKKVKRVELSPEQKRIYKEMKDDFITFVENKKQEGQPQAVVANIALTKALRLMQIISGFVVTEEGDTVAMDRVPRLEVTKDLLTEITGNNKCIIWCSFKHNYKQLGELCEKLKLKHVFLTGQMNTVEKKDAMNAFQNDEDVKVMIANRRAGGIGVNLTAAAYSIVYSRNFSLGEEKQSEARNHRGGSEIHEKIIKIDLVTENTIDEILLKALEGKHDLAQAVLEYGTK